MTAGEYSAEPDSKGKTMESNLKTLAAKINAVLAAKGYKPEEAHAQYWSKLSRRYGIDTRLELIERIYMIGGKASGYIDPSETGEPIIHGVQHQMLLYLLDEVVASEARH